MGGPIEGAGDQLRAIIERIEHLEECRDATMVQAARYRYIRCIAAVGREAFKSATSFIKHCLVEVARGDGAQQHAGESSGRFALRTGSAGELCILFSRQVGDDRHFQIPHEGARGWHRSGHAPATASQSNSEM